MLHTLVVRPGDPDLPLRHLAGGGRISNPNRTLGATREAHVPTRVCGHAGTVKWKGQQHACCPVGLGENWAGGWGHIAGHTALAHTDPTLDRRQPPPSSVHKPTSMTAKLVWVATPQAVGAVFRAARPRFRWVSLVSEATPRAQR